MSYFNEWEQLIKNQTKATFNDFWIKYSSTEKRIYSSLLDNPGNIIMGKFSELVQKYNADPVIFMGFLDGINNSLNEKQNLENLNDDSDIKLDINLERLYLNMLGAKADYLYNLPQWDDILTKEKKREILKTHRKRNTVVKNNKIGRNDSCPCGSGKKYKHCCGK